MITTNGKIYVKRYLAGHVPAIATCIAYGIGRKAEAAGDQSLEFEIGRAEVTLTSYDFVNDRLIYKAVLPDSLTANVSEVALYSQMENPVAGNFASKVLASFDSLSENWTNVADNTPGGYTAVNARIGGDSLAVTPGANSSAGFVLNDVLYDLSGNSGADIFKFAYNVGSNVSAVQVRFRTDASNYYYYNIASPSAGYKIESYAKGNALVAGTPDWSTINSIEVRVNATTGGAASVEFDGIRIEDTDTINPDYVMVARDVIATPFTKVQGRTQEVEFSLGVTV